MRTIKNVQIPGSLLGRLKAESKGYRPDILRFFLVFLDFSPYERAVREPRNGEHESRSGEKEKPLVTLDVNLKRVKLITTKGTNGNSASTCLSADNFLKQGRPGKLFV